MSLWKDNTAPRQTPAPGPEPREPARFDATPKPELVPSPVVAPVTRADTSLPRKESLIAADITIESKIEGGGSVASPVSSRATPAYAYIIKQWLHDT